MTNIYFIECNNHIKIGRSENVQKRLKELQTGNNENMRLLYIIEQVEETFETFIHEICSRYRENGEWFKKDVINHLLNHPWYKENMKPPTK
jgi:hypothetical protein